MPDEIKIKDRIFTELFSEEKLEELISTCVFRVRSTIDATKDLVVIGVLNGGIPLCNDIAFSLSENVIVDYVKAVSYGDSLRSSGEVKLLLDSVTDVSGKAVLIVDDIIDSGRTVSFLKDHFTAKGAQKVMICSLFYKRNALFPEPDFFGAEIEDQFIVGYGLDYAGKGRNLRKILKLK